MNFQVMEKKSMRMATSSARRLIASAASVHYFTASRKNPPSSITPSLSLDNQRVRCMEDVWKILHISSIENAI